MALTVDDLDNGERDLKTVSAVANSRDPDTLLPVDSYPTRQGDSTDTLNGRLKKIGYLPPVIYAGGISFTALDNVKTVEESGFIYAPKPSELPFTTSGTWSGDDEDKFFVVQGVTVEGLQSYVNAEFATSDDLVAASSQNLGTVDFNDYVGRQVRTVASNSISRMGGESYLITNVIQDHLSTVVNGVRVGANHSLGGGLYAKLLTDNLTSIYSFGYTGSNAAADSAAQEAATDYVRDNDNEATSARFVGNIVVGTNDLPNSSAPRDAFQVSRTISGKTDCHGFADKTVVTDSSTAGTYGIFDGTVVYEGAKDYNHLFCFQDRAEYNGTGSLGSWGNIIWPVKNGSGTCSRTDIEIKDVAGAGGEITSHIGLYIQNLTRATSNVAINVAQNNGFSFLATGENAEFRVAGNARFTNTLTAGNVQPEAGVPFNWSSANAGDFKGFAASNNNGATIGTIGDGEFAIVADGVSRLVMRDTTAGRSVVPGVSGAQSLGDGDFRWSEVFAVNGTINTSDERLKDFFDIDDAEKKAALEIKKAIKKFKWKSAVDEKGDEARYHFGVSAQTCVSILESHGLNPDEYSFICYDKWNQSIDDEGNIINPAGDSYAIRYSELAMFILASI